MLTSDKNNSPATSETLNKMNLLYTNIRSQIEHEDNLVNQRLTWLLAAQAFLFSGYYAVASNQEHFPRQLYVIIAISIVGIIFTLATYNGILAAFKSLRMLYTSWYSFVIQKELCQCLNNTRSPSTNDLLEPRYIILKEKIDSELLERYGYPQITWRGNGFISAAITASLFPSTLVSVWIFLLALKISEKAIILNSTSGFLVITITMTTTVASFIIMYAYLLQNR